MTHPSTVADTLDAGFTPGPWRVAGEDCPECWQIENSEGDFIAQCEDRRGFASLDAVANARLIAAAPDAVKMAAEIKHSIAQARLPGNDWRRELALIENTVDQWFAIASGEVQP